MTYRDSHSYITQADFLAESNLTKDLPANTLPGTLRPVNEQRLGVIRSDTMETTSTVQTTRSRRARLAALGASSLAHISTTFTINWGATLERIHQVEFSLPDLCKEIKRSSTLPKAEIIQADRYCQKNDIYASSVPGSPTPTSEQAQGCVSTFGSSTSSGRHLELGRCVWKNVRK